MTKRLTMPLNERCIVALDLPAFAPAAEMVERLRPTVGYFKVGLELFLAEGFAMVEHILGLGCKVMLDLKFYDVPNTVAAAVRQVSGRGASLATLHGERAIMQAAAAAATDSGCDLLAVTALTSLSQEDLNAMGFPGNLEDLVLQRAALAKESGLAGVVCSPWEAARIRKELGWDLRIVTPGIRPAGPVGDDQKRIATPGDAIRNGADHIVVGRPICRAEDPAAAAAAILEEIDAVLTN